MTSLHENQTMTLWSYLKKTTIEEQMDIQAKVWRRENVTLIYKDHIILKVTSRKKNIDFKDAFNGEGALYKDSHKSKILNNLTNHYFFMEN